MRHRSRLTWIALAAAALFGAERLGADDSLLARLAARPVGADGASATDRGLAATVAAHGENTPPAADAARADAAPPAPTPGSLESTAAPANPFAGAAPAPSDPRIELDPVELEPGSRSVRISGFDPFAPRQLELWRRVDARAALIARGESAPDKALEFPRVILPRDGLEVVVTPAGSDPDAPDASLPRSLEATAPEPPHAELLESSPGRWRLRARANASGGEILLAGADGEIFARHPVPQQPTAGSPIVELIVELPAADTHVWLAQLLPDGRRSEWRMAAPFPPRSRRPHEPQP